MEAGILARIPRFINDDDWLDDGDFVAFGHLPQVIALV
jgi:hypothetical protein